MSLILSCACGTFFLLLVASTSLDMKVYVLSSCILLCQVQLTSLVRAALSLWEMEEQWVLGRGGRKGLWEEGKKGRLQ